MMQSRGIAHQSDPLFTAWGNCLALAWSRCIEEGCKDPVWSHIQLYFRAPAKSSGWNDHQCSSWWLFCFSTSQIPQETIAFQTWLCMNDSGIVLKCRFLFIRFGSGLGLYFSNNEQVLLILLACGAHFEKHKCRTSNELLYVPLKISVSKWCVCVCACVKLVMVLGGLKLLSQMSSESLGWPGRTIHGVYSIWYPSSPY